MTSGPKIYSEEYYERLKAIQGNHWWTLGMNDIMDAVLIKRLKLIQNLSVIDMGCGSGVGLAWMQSRLKPKTIVGIDLSPHGIKRCEATHAKLIVGSVTEVPVQNNSYDLAICNDVLQHVEDDKKVVQEALRILKPGGYFFARTNGKFICPLVPGCLRLYTSQQLRNILLDVGFIPEIVSHTNVLGSMIGVLKNYRTANKFHKSQHDHHHSHEEKEPKDVGGIMIKPSATGGMSFMERIMRQTLKIEGTLMNISDKILPFGHTHIVLGQKPLL